MRRKGLVITIWTLSLLLGWFLKNACAEPMSAAMALIYGSAIGAGGGILGGLLGRGGDSEDIDYEAMMRYKQLPDYPEATGAREKWWSQLQDWGTQPGYGAISPEWDKIWDLAKNKLTQYYWGGTMDTGLAGKVRASAARRHVSQSPALENMLTAMGMQEAQDVSGLASQEAINKATSSESGRQNWLTSLMGLSQMKPSYITPSGAVPGAGYGVGEMIGDVSGGISGLFSQYAQQQSLAEQQTQQQDWLMKLFEQYSGGGGGSLSSGLGAAKNYGSDESMATQFPGFFGGL